MIKITIKVFFLRFKPTVVSSLLYLVPLPRTFRISFSSDIRWYFSWISLNFPFKTFHLSVCKTIFILDFRTGSINAGSGCTSPGPPLSSECSGIT